MAEAKSFAVEQLQELFQLFAQTEDRLRATTHPRFVFEVTAVRAARLFQHKPIPSSPQPEQEHKAPPVVTQREPGTVQRPPQKSNRPQQTSASSQPHEKTQRLSNRPSPESNPPKNEAPSAMAPAILPDDWHKVVEAVIKNFPNIGTFLEMSTLVKIEGSQVIIGFPKTASVACSRIQKEENRLLVAQVCQNIVGTIIQLRVVELTKSQENGLTFKQAHVQKKTHDEKALLEEARASPLVQQTMELFGGEVTKASRMVEKKEE
jgi:DNA polymerase III gamma/tau subunit